MDNIPDKEELEKHMRPQTEILEDLVSQVRGLGARMRELDPEISDRESRFVSQKYRDFDPRMLDEIMHMMMDSRDGEMMLLLLAGFVRSQMPWLAEVLVESHRELKCAGPEEAREIGHRLMRIVKQTTRGPFGERFVHRNNYSHMMVMELPHFIDRAISLRVESRLAPEGGESSKSIDEM